MTTTTEADVEWAALDWYGWPRLERRSRAGHRP